MKKILIYSLFAISLFAACSKEENPTPPAAEGEESQTDLVYSLSVDLPEVNTKTSIAYNNDKYRIYWENGDVISAGSNNISSALTGISDKETSQAQFTFTSPVANGAFVRFPGVADPSVLEIPSEQTSVGGQYDSNATPLWGTVSVTASSTGVPQGKLTMNNVMAMLRFSITGTHTLRMVSIETLGGEPLNGVFTMNTSNGAVTAKGNNTGRNDIIFAEQTLSESTAFDLYVPVLAATYSKGFSMNIYDTEGKKMKVSFFKTGQVLTTKNLAEFTINYQQGNEIVIAPLSGLVSGSGSYDDVLSEEDLTGYIKIGQYNIWSPTSRESNESYPYRQWDYAESCLAETIALMDCDIICFNEISNETYSTNLTYSLENAVREFTTDYEFSLNWPNGTTGWLWWEEDDYSYTHGFAYKKSAVDLLSSGKFWLNADCSESDDSGSYGGRTCVWAKFKNLETNSEFYLAISHMCTDTHGTSEGEHSEGYYNLMTAVNLVKGISSKVGNGAVTDTTPIVLVGDLNSSAETANNAYRYLTGQTFTYTDEAAEGVETIYGPISMPFSDSRDDCKENGTLPSTEYGKPGTALGAAQYAPRLGQEEYRYDNILYSNCEVKGYQSYRNMYQDPEGNKWYPSDHLPISVYVKF